MKSDVKKHLSNVTFIKLHFTVEMTENTLLSQYKASAIRGGMGEMMLRSNCVRDRQCESCPYVDECIVQRIMYAKYKIKPPFVGNVESIGYIVECEDERNRFKVGDELEFAITLFGTSVVYFNQILMAIHSLGVYGLGTSKSHYTIKSITNTDGEVIMSEGNVYMENYVIKSLADYVSTRKAQLENCANVSMEVVTPTQIKYKGQVLKKLDIDAIAASMCRRVGMLECFEGNFEERLLVDMAGVEIVKSGTKEVIVSRHSNRKNEDASIYGIKGFIELRNAENIVDILLASEIVHVGKNTSFGFGKCKIKSEK